MMDFAFLEIMKEKRNERQKCVISSNELKDMEMRRMKMFLLMRGLPGGKFGGPACW